MIEIRGIQPADAATLRALYVEMLRGTFTHFPRDAITKYAEDWTVELIEQRSSAGRHVLIGAFADGTEAVGFLFGSPPDGGVGTIIWLGVAIGYRGHGIGERLMRESFAAYRRCSCHKVKVYTETEAGKRFYLRIGMKIEGFHPGHWFGVDFWSLGRQI